MKYPFTTLLLFLATSSFAGIQEDAQKVIQYRLAMVNPTNTFNKWQADQWLFLAISCANQAKLKLPTELEKAKVYTSGSHSMSEDTVKMCAALASGPSPQCHGFNTRQTPFAMPSNGLPSDYAFIANRANIPKNGSTVLVGGYCDMVSGKRETRQFFAGPATMRWLSEPKSTSMNTASGPQTLTMGTVMFEVDGSTLKMPTMVIVPNK